MMRENAKKSRFTLNIDYGSVQSRSIWNVINKSEL